jgi:hypothetical protein
MYKYLILIHLLLAWSTFISSFKYFLAYFPKVNLCDLNPACVFEYSPFNIWNPEPIFMQLSIYIIAKWLKVKVTLRLTVSQSVSLGVEPHLGFMTRYLLLFDSYGLIFL